MKKKEPKMVTLYHNKGQPMVSARAEMKKLLKAAAHEMGLKRADKKARRRIKEAMEKRQNEIAGEVHPQ